MERGLNQQANGVVRQYYLKSSRFTTPAWKQVKVVENKYIIRPGKSLGFRALFVVFLAVTDVYIVTLLGDSFQPVRRMEFHLRGNRVSASDSKRKTGAGVFDLPCSHGLNDRAVHCE